MSQDQWSAVDRYITDLYVPPDPALDGALRSMAAEGIPLINVTPNQGRLLHILALAKGARNILEIGTLGGYSAIWLARALAPGGRLITLEANPKHATLARANIANAGLAEVVDVRLGPALETLPQLVAEQAGPFDLVFIDADTLNTPAYIAWSLKLTQPGSLIITDNVVRDGAVLDVASSDPYTQAVRDINETLASAPGLAATVLQTVGSKGYDGLALAVVTEQKH
jgi:predicted O-methyltransferase YrrM